jgi:hypothetical protein
VDALSTRLRAATPKTTSRLRWPHRDAVRVYLGYAALSAALMALVYFSCNWLAAQRQERLHLYAAWELGIPFVRR